ncbi:DUF885 domain-containing protein [bacterium]|jgi:uncharacterized protein (DUF885 family)|nr:DUF885 domain-containing protein [bacterium]
MNPFRTVWLLTLALFFAPSLQANDIDFCSKSYPSSLKGSNSARLKKFFEDLWVQRMKAQPESATYNGYPRNHDRWSDLSKAARKKDQETVACQLQIFKNFKTSSLEEKIWIELAIRQLNDDLTSSKFGRAYLFVDQLSGPQTEVVRLLLRAPSLRLMDYQDRISRLKALPKYLEQGSDLLREGIQAKITLPRFLAEKVPAQIDSLLNEKVEENPLFESFKSFPKDLLSNESEIQENAKKAIRDFAIPAFKKFKQFLVSEYIPACRDGIAFTQVRNGEAWYKAAVKIHTTTDLTPQEIHKIGLSEVERISKEMDQVVSKAGKGSKKDFEKFLKTDSQFYYSTPEELLAGYRDVAKRIDPELPKLFGKLPRLPYGVSEMPAHYAPSSPTAYYLQGRIDAGKAGFFEANTYNLKSRPKWEMEALTVHEAVPGHHLQIALAQELGELPELLREASFTAFTEGWGLYSESLGDDLGLYKSPYSKYGQLSFEMWRAVRLVVDTGMHTLGWSKEKALAYFMEHVSKDRLQSEVEIDRYITWPGQALAYKIGQLKIQELRDRAKKELGDKFSIRDFHDEILSHGTVPLDTLEQLFSSWLVRQKKSKKV